MRPDIADVDGASLMTKPREGCRTDGASSAVLALKEVEFSYGSGPLVVDRMTFAVDAGKILGVVGPSGCGKSTILGLVSGLLQPTAGSVSHFRDGETRRHPLSMVFQKDTLLPWLTVAENVRFFARFKRHGLAPRGVERLKRARKRRRDQLDDRVDELLELADLSDSADYYPYQLSGGMRRRLAFLTAVAPNPQMLLLDEPFSSVDEPTRIGIHGVVFDITRRMGITALLVTHDLAEAITVCDRVLILTRRPTHIATEHQIPFGDERDMHRLRATPEYLSLYGSLWNDLSEQISGNPSRERTA
jgi:ABC-type nitrate/sulfonate/bicarbonate transport system ATPase subunit